MWMIDVRLLCKNHLLGEHGEIHKHKHVFEKKWKINGRIKPFIAIVPQDMKIRHDELVGEMIRRGYNHKSPYEMPDISYLPEEYKNVKIDLSYNLLDLITRCLECHKRIMSFCNDKKSI